MLSGARPVTFIRTLSNDNTYRLQRTVEGEGIRPDTFIVTTPDLVEWNVHICKKAVKKYNLRGVNYFNMEVKKSAKAY